MHLPLLVAARYPAGAEDSRGSIAATVLVVRHSDAGNHKDLPQMPSISATVRAYMLRSVVVRLTRDRAHATIGNSLESPLM